MPREDTAMIYAQQDTLVMEIYWTWSYIGHADGDTLVIETNWTWKNIGHRDPEMEIHY